MNACGGKRALAGPALGVWRHAAAGARASPVEHPSCPSAASGAAAPQREQVDEADTHELRVKHEGDLKRAIKKLQRHRDNLKMWASSSEIKQKDPLVNCRRAIEEKMEAFKTLEYETKHKTYSRAGMTASGELDEEGLARKDARDFLSATIADLSAQIDELEADMETERSKRRPDTKLLASLVRLGDVPAGEPRSADVAACSNPLLPLADAPAKAVAIEARPPPRAVGAPL